MLSVFFGGHPADGGASGDGGSGCQHRERPDDWVGGRGSRGNSREPLPEFPGADGTEGTVRSETGMRGGCWWL